MKPEATANTGESDRNDEDDAGGAGCHQRLARRGGREAVGSYESVRGSVKETIVNAHLFP
jgi:hypothetical protein